MTTATWIFGYGSLIWRPGFACVEQQDATASGWSRRFWQGSPDHRGIPGAPGRVVTLVSEPGASCVGRAFRVAPVAVDEVLESLDVREQGGHDRRALDLRLADGRDVRSIAYIAPSRNPHWLGPAEFHATVEQIRRSHGPSGSNVEYVVNLADALAAIGYDDPHVQALARALRTGGNDENS